MRSWLTPGRASKSAPSQYFTTKYALNALSAKPPPGRSGPRHTGEHGVVVAVGGHQPERPLAQADRRIELGVEREMTGIAAARTMATRRARHRRAEVDEALADVDAVHLDAASASSWAWRPVPQPTSSTRIPGSRPSAGTRNSTSCRVPFVNE